MPGKKVAMFNQKCSVNASSFCLFVRLFVCFVLCICLLTHLLTSLENCAATSRLLTRLVVSEL